LIVKRISISCALLVSCCFGGRSARADTTAFFSDTQVATLVASGVTSDTISSHGYLFTYTRDKLFTGGGPNPIGRPVRVPWPDGVEAQAVTTPPPGITDHKARITLSRVDGELFDLTSFTAKLLANTFGTGASIEIMPLVDGEDAFDDPLFFDATGFAGSTFSYDESPNPWGSTALLKGFDTYKIGLFVDCAFTALTLEGPPVMGAPGDTDLDGTVTRRDVALLARSYGMTSGSTWFTGDFDADRATTLTDVKVLQANLTLGGASPIPPVTANVPEPSAMILVAICCTILLACRLRRATTSNR
jgi:hypothetical protein